MTPQLPPPGLLNPAEARFLSVDPRPGDCANPYTYAFGDPLNHPGG
jgi:hypothetical protein